VLKDKGFTILETLICLLVISIFCLLSISYYHDIDYDYVYFINDYLQEQSKALTNREKVELDYGLAINDMGHPSRADSIMIGKHKVIVHLGNGYITNE